MAIRCEMGGSTVTFFGGKGTRHHHLLADARSHGAELPATPDDAGFLLSDGRYVTRAEAYKIAMASGQIKRRPGPEHYQGDELFSEDLW